MKIICGIKLPFSVKNTQFFIIAASYLQDVHDQWHTENFNPLIAIHSYSCMFQISAT
jgi:hypothetical protein